MSHDKPKKKNWREKKTMDQQPRFDPSLSSGKPVLPSPRPDLLCPGAHSDTDPDRNSSLGTATLLLMPVSSLLQLHLVRHELVPAPRLHFENTLHSNVRRVVLEPVFKKVLLHLLVPFPIQIRIQTHNRPNLPDLLREPLQVLVPCFGTSSRKGRRMKKT